jgi:uncharacterized protein (DUF362 family)/NAD-dependent dihydropyrimidine dehydrogenase PreA subunit
MSKTLIQPASYEECAQAIDRAFETFPLDVRGKKVLIKPNVLRGGKPEEGITTHPAVMKAVVDRVEQMRPASIVVGDNPGLLSYGANEVSFKNTGLMEAAKGYYQNIGNESVTLAFNPEYLETVAVSKAVLDADVIISLPKFKTHGLTVVTGGLKNSYGILPGAQKAMLHRLAGTPTRFNELIIDVFRLRPPDLFIVDAIVCMEGNGPASPALREIGLILASDNAVALDATISRLMGVEPGRLRFIQRAKEVGLGDFDEASIHIVGKLEPIPGFKLPALGGEAVTGSQQIKELMERRTLLRPKADPELCTACETCIEQCPVSALSLVEALPVVDPDKCITCFCCQEICPEKAITLQ